jgi:hypothetical protein
VAIAWASPTQKGRSLCEAAFPVIEGQANSPSTTMHPTKSENLMAFPALKEERPPRGEGDLSV